MHLRAVRALKIVEIDYSDFGCGIAANGPSGSVDGKCRVRGKVECLQTRQSFAVRGDEEIERRGLGTVREDYGERFVTRKRAWLPCSNRD